MFEVMKSEEAVIEQNKNGAHITAPVSYPNNKNYIRQEMDFDGAAKPQAIQIFDEDNTVQLKMVFEKVEYNNCLLYTSRRKFIHLLGVLILRQPEIIPLIRTRWILSYGLMPMML